MVDRVKPWFMVYGSRFCSWFCLWLCSWFGSWFGSWFYSWFMVHSNILICKGLLPELQATSANLAPFLRANISINKACNPINLGVKWKLLISSFLECHWIWDLDLNCLRYAGKHDRNLEIETAQNDWSLIQGVYKKMPKSI